MGKFIGALDQGTTSTRFIVFDHGGQVAGLDQKEHQQIFPQPGWVEHNPLEIWNNTQKVIRGALAKAGLKGGDLAAIGITNQRETTVVWNRHTGKPYGNAIVWQCTRTDGMCRELIKDGGQDRFRETTGLPVAAYFSGPKIKWILDHIPEARTAALNGDAIFGTMETWVIWWLTGGPGKGAHVTDVTNASRTLLMDLKTLSWDNNILEILGIPQQMLPRIVPSSDEEFWGLTANDGPFGGQAPVCGALGDQQAALVGQACFEKGEAKNTYGTGCFLLLNTGPKPIPSKHGLITTVAYQMSGHEPVYALEGSIAIGGALVQWFRDNLCLIKTAPEIETLAGTVKDNGGMFIVPAFSGLFAPYWRDDARGVMVGLTRYIHKGHMARAVLEACAYQTRDILEAMNKDAGHPLPSLKVDGGMVENNLLMQIQSDILNVPVIRPRIAETTALGAAYAAGLAVGFWSSQEELRQNWSEDRSWQPTLTEQERQTGYRNWKRAVERTFHWVE